MVCVDVNELIEASNELSDEFEPSEVVIQFINDAIAKINVECDSKFPYLSLNNSDEEPPFPEKWQRALIIPFTVGRIKQKDSSQFEYSDSYAEFMANLDEFKARYEIPEEYIDPDSHGGRGTNSDIFTSPPWFYGGF